MEKYKYCNNLISFLKCIQLIKSLSGSFMLNACQGVWVWWNTAGPDWADDCTELRERRGELKLPEWLIYLNIKTVSNVRPLIISGWKLAALSSWILIYYDEEQEYRNIIICWLTNEW